MLYEGGRMVLYAGGCTWAGSLDGPGSRGARLGGGGYLMVVVGWGITVEVCK